MGTVSCVLSGRVAAAIGVAGAMGSAAGLVSLALFTAALITFPSLPKTGARLFATPSVAIAVNRALKGDRLPVSARPAGLPSARLPRAHLPDQSPPEPAHPRTRAQIPLGCDAAFSPIASPLLAHVFRRCMV